MYAPLIPIALFLAGQLGVAIWWASRVSSQLDHVSLSLKETREDIASLRDEVQNHDTAIAVMRAVAKAQQSNGAGHG